MAMAIVSASIVELPCVVVLLVGARGFEPPTT